MPSLYEVPSELLGLWRTGSVENVLDGLIDRELEVSDLAGINELSVNCVNIRELGIANCGL